MFNSFLNTICRIGIFMICAQAIIHFRPGKAYEKYLKMLVGVMVLVQIFSPLMELLSAEGQENIAARVIWFEQQMNESTAQAAESAFEYNDILNRMTLEEIKFRLEEAALEEEALKEAALKEAALEEPALEETDREEADMDAMHTPEGSEAVGDDTNGEAGRITPVDKITVEIGE